MRACSSAFIRYCRGSIICLGLAARAVFEPHVSVYLTMWYLRPRATGMHIFLFLFAICLEYFLSLVSKTSWRGSLLEFITNVLGILQSPQQRHPPVAIGKQKGSFSR